MSTYTDSLLRAAAELLLEAMPGDEFDAAEQMLLEIMSRRLIDRNNKLLAGFGKK